MKKVFEKWAISHFGDNIKSSLSNFDEKNGYQDELINAMWIGFNGHAILAGS